MAIQNTFYLDVDIKRDNYVEEPKVTQNDSAKFVLRLTDDGVDYPLVGVSTYTLASLRPDGQSVLTVGSKTATNEITFNLGTTEVSVAGDVKASIQLYDADGRVSSIPFTYEVSKDFAIDYVPSADEQTLIQLVLGEGPAILASAKAATASANTAATNASNAIVGFDEVIAEARVAATNATEKAGLANTAATNANSKATLADQKATLADNAATNASAATQAINLVLPNAINLEYVEPYSATTQYRKNNIVRHSRNSYIALQDTLGNDPTGNMDSTFWGVIAIGGADGTGAGTVTSVNGVEPDDTGNVTIIITASWANLAGKPSQFPPSPHDHSIAQIAGLQEALDNSGDSIVIAKQINTLYDLTTGLIRYRAFDELLKEASNRVDGGTVFAHDMNGNIIGMTLDEANSQNVVIRDGKMMMIAKSEVTKTVTDSTVVSSAYDTSGNGGRKLVRLSNGWLIACVKEGSTLVRLYKSINNGVNWTYLQGGNAETGLSDTCIETDGKRIFWLWNFNNTYNTFRVVNAIDGNIINSTIQLDKSQTAIGNCSLAINPEGTELHAAWASKNATYPNSFNIRYAKGVISQVDGSVTWGTVEQVTTANESTVDGTSPSIIINSSGNPTIIFVSSIRGPVQIRSNSRSVSGWQTSNTGFSTMVYDGTTYAQSNPSAIFVPKSVNGLANGRIWVAWHGNDATGYLRGRVSYSDDGGVTWSTMYTLPIANLNNFKNVSISANKRNEIFIVLEGDGSAVRLGSYKNSQGVWGAYTSIKTGGLNTDVSTLFDTSLDFSAPLFIYKDGTSKVGFYGTWKEPVETPTLTAKAVYDIPSTDYVGAFVKKIGATTVQAYVNDTLMDAELVDNEYEFTKQLATEAPVKLRLELSRTSTSGGESDAITRILGGRA